MHWAAATWAADMLFLGTVCLLIVPESQMPKSSVTTNAIAVRRLLRKVSLS